MSIYRELSKGGSIYSQYGQPPSIPYSNTSSPKGVKKRLMAAALGIGSFLLLKKAGSGFSKFFIDSIKSGVFKESSFITKGYKEAKELGVLNGNFSDIFRVLSSTFRKVDYSIGKVTEPWTRSYDAFIKFRKRANQYESVSRRVIRTGDFFKKYPIKNVMRGGFVRGAKEAVGFTFLSAFSQAFIHSIKPEERDVNKRYGLRGIPRISAEFAKSLGTNVLFFGVGKAISTAAKIGFYGPGIRNFIKKTGADKFIGNIYGARLRVMERLAAGSSFARKFADEIHAEMRFPYIKKSRRGFIKSAFSKALRSAKYQAARFRVRVKRFSDFSYALRHIPEGRYTSDVMAKHNLKLITDRHKEISNRLYAIGAERVRMRPKEALSIIKKLRDTGLGVDGIEKYLKGLGLDPSLASKLGSMSESEFSKLYKTGAFGNIYKPGFYRIGRHIENMATSRIFKNMIIRNIPEHYQGLANILMSVTGLNFSGSRLLARFFAPSKSSNQSDYILGTKRISLRDPSGIRHGLYYLDKTAYRITHIGGVEHDVSIVSQGLDMYESKLFDAMKGEAAAAYYSANPGLYEKIQRTQRGGIRTVKKILKRWISKGPLSVTSEDANLLSDQLSLNKLTIFGRLIEDSKFRRVIKETVGNDSELAKVFNMDSSTMVKTLEKIINKQGVASKSVLSHINQVLEYAQMHTNDEISTMLKTSHVGREFNSTTMDAFLRSFIIDHYLPKGEMRAKVIGQIEEGIRNKIRLPKIYKDWLEIMKRLPPSEEQSFFQTDENIKAFLKGIRDIPKVDVTRPLSAILKFGNLGIGTRLNLNEIFNPETGRTMGPLRNQPFVMLKRGFSISNKSAPSPFEVWASTPIRAIWSFFGAAKNILSIKKNTIDYIREHIPAVDKLFTMKPFSSLQNGVSLIPFNTDVANKRILQLTKDLWKPLALYGGLKMGYKITDTILDEFPIPGIHSIIENSALGEGLTPFIYNTYALGRLALSKIGDITGITSAAQYLEGLMPGSTTWLPGAIYGAVMGSPLGLSGAALGSLVYGGVNRMLSPFLPDMTKSTQDLEDLYSGRKDVAVRKNRYWPLGLTPWEGEGIDYYRPSTFHMVQSQFRNTQSGVGSKWQDLLLGDWMFGFNPIRTIFDPMYKERMHYFTRPAPLTALPFWNVPLIGPALAVTVGQILKPQKMMHTSMLRETLPGVIQGDVSNDKNSILQQEMIGNLSPSTAMEYMKNNSSSILMNGARTKFGTEIERSIYGRAVSEVAYRTMELAGLRGFMTATALGTQTPFAAQKYLQMYGEGDGFMKDYWTMNMNDIGGGLSEMMRRFGPAQRIKTENPLQSAMISDFPYNLNIKGDPYTTIKGGIFRLPGPAYEALHDVYHTFPASAQMLGRNIHEIRDIMVGWEDIHDDREKNLLDNQLDIRTIILNMFRQNGMLLKENLPIYDVNNNIIGIADGIVKHGKDSEILSIKPLDPEEFAKMNNPDDPTISEMNFYLANQRKGKGRVIYVNKKNPLQMKDFVINYDPHRLKEDIANIKKAREEAEDIRRSGYAIDYGRSYSWLNKLKIYADVSPFSQQYKMALGIVEKQIKAGVLPKEANDEVQTIIDERNARIQRYPIFFRRFSEPSIFGTIGDIIKPKSVSERQLKMSFSPFIKPPEDYSLPERALGALWETFTHANTPYNRKFFFQQDPYELYKNFHLYDKEYKSWTHPYEDWVKPYVNTALASRNMLEGVANFTTAGWLLGGSVGAEFAALAGAAYAPISNQVQKLTGAFIPHGEKKARNIVDFYDKVKYVRNMQFYNMTGNENYLKNANNTMIGATGISSYMKGLPGNDKFFASAFMDVTNPDEQALIMQVAPKYMKPVIKAAWTHRDIGTYLDKDQGELPMPESDWVGWDRGVNDSDIETKEFQEAGLNPRDYGFGYNDQSMRASSLSQNAVLLMDKDESDFTNVDFMSISGSIRKALASYGIHASVSVIGSPSHLINVKVFIP